MHAATHAYVMIMQPWLGPPNHVWSYCLVVACLSEAIRPPVPVVAVVGRNEPFVCRIRITSFSKAASHLCSYHII